MEIRYTINEFVELFQHLCQKPAAQSELDKAMQESAEIGIIFYGDGLKNLDDPNQTVKEIGIYIPD